MAIITLADGTAFSCASDDTLLRAALRAGIGLSYECNVGACGVCKTTLENGNLEDLRPHAPGLSDRDRKKGRILPCQSRPLGDCTLAARDRADERPVLPPRRHAARLVAIERLTHDMRRFLLETEAKAQFLPGQYALLTLPGGDTRAYSMSNIPDGSGRWEFIIRRVPGGSATSRLFDPQVEPGALLEIDAPYGHAYLRESPRDVVCVAGGSGLAPMLSIARAVAAEKSGRRAIVFHGVRTTADRCGDADVTSMGPSVSHHIALSDDEPRNGEARCLVHELVLAKLDGALSEFDFYAAGPPPMLEALSDALIEKGDVNAERLRFDRFF